MQEIDFQKLVGSLPKSGRDASKSGHRLSPAADPKPFVAPTLHVRASDSTDPSNPFAVEVLFVEASAAVGKSTIAARLSATGQLPLLDLAGVPVSTGSFQALVADYPWESDPLAAFHAGELPVIVDALDEGRLLSGELGFESFLQTTAEFLLKDRSVSNRPKLVLFGRRDSIEVARTMLELAGVGTTTCSAEVGFFGEAAAWELIKSYAESATSAESAYGRNPGPVSDLIQAYFDAIEAALGLDKGALWTSTDGRAFAGYAPVLAALGGLLAEMDNFIEVANRLRQNTGVREAWQVIEEVLDAILVRERGKLTTKLARQITVAVPPEAYDAQEQLRLLSQFVHGQPLAGSTRVHLTGADQAKYNAMIGQSLPDHPFLKQRDFGNAVLASLVLANTVAEDLLRQANTAFLAAASRQPFLWRSLRRHLRQVPMIDGAYLGFILSSFWSDPLVTDSRVRVHELKPGTARVDLPGDGVVGSGFEVIPPITLYAQVRDCDLHIPGQLRFEGVGKAGNPRVFYINGPAILVSQALEVDADVVALQSDVWLEAQEIVASPRLELRERSAARVGWGGQVGNRFPWNRLVPSLTSPHGEPESDALGRLLKECSQRLSAGEVLTLYPDHRITEDDPRMRWALREYPEIFPRVIKLLIDHKLASSEKMAASGTAKVRVRFKTTWGELHRATKGESPSTQLGGFIAAAREAVGG